MTAEGEREVSDVAKLEEEFPAWDFGVAWVTVGNGPDARTLYAWSLEHGGPPLTAPDADGMRRKIREATP